MKETIDWVSVSERLPDADETVLIVIPEFTEPCAVTHWAEMPKGPR